MQTEYLHLDPPEDRQLDPLLDEVFDLTADLEQQAKTIHDLCTCDPRQLDYRRINEELHELEERYELAARSVGHLADIVQFRREGYVE